MCTLVSIVLVLFYLSSYAMAQSTTATNYQEPNRPENAFDGDTATRFSGTGDMQNRVPNILWHDFGQEETSNVIRIAWLESVKRENYFELYVSADNEEWIWVEPHDQSFSIRDGIVWEAYTFPAMPVRYLRILGYGNSSRFGQWVSIREVEIGYDDEIVTIDEAFILSSGWDLLNVPENVVDNDYTTRWSYFNNPWIQFDLWDPVTVTAVRVAWYQGDIRRSFFDIEVSEDEQNWQLVYQGESSGTTTELETYEFASPVLARYVRLTGHGNSSKCVKCSKWTSITEMRVDH